MTLFIRFLSVGVLNTVFGYVVIFTCMYVAGLPAIASNVIGYGSGFVLSYALNRFYAFRSKQKPLAEMMWFTLVFVIAFACNFLALVFFLDVVLTNALLAQLLAGVVYVAVSFLLNKRFVFRQTRLP
jgi:putative flippase GtrA